MSVSKRKEEKAKKIEEDKNGPEVLEFHLELQKITTQGLADFKKRKA